MIQVTWQVHNLKCFHTSASPLEIYGISYHSQSSPSLALQYKAWTWVAQNIVADLYMFENTVGFVLLFLHLSVKILVKS